MPMYSRIRSFCFALITGASSVEGSVPAPTFMVLTRASSLSWNSSRTSPCTAMRLVAVQRWPLVANAPHAPCCDGSAESRIGHDDEAFFGAELKRHPLHHAAAGLVDLAADFERAGEGDAADVGMLDQGLSGFFAEAGDEIEDA